MSEIDSEEESLLLSQIYFKSEEKSQESEIDEANIMLNVENSSDAKGEDENDESPSESDSDSESAENAPQGGNRYFGDGPSCFNCGGSGHVLKNCPEINNIPCSLCGKKGHLRQTCPTEICHNCNMPGHLSKNCMNRKRRFNDRDRCDFCGLEGHSGSECSFKWRVYETRKSGFFRNTENIFRISLRSYCYACGDKGHFGDDCNRSYRVTAFETPSVKRIRFTVKPLD